MLSTTLDLEANPFVTALQRVNAAVEGFHGRIVSISAAFSGLRDAAAMAHGVFEKFSGVLELGGHLTDLSAATGEAKSELLILEQSFKNAGKGADDVGGFVSRLHKAIGGLNDEGKNTHAAFAELKTSADELRNLPLLEQVKKLSEGFSGIEDAERRGQVAMNLFGKSGEELLAVFRDPEAISTARTQVGGLAGTIEKLASTLDAVGDALGGVTLKFQQLAGGFLLGAGITGTLAEALNRIDLTGVGVSLGQIAHVALEVGAALNFVVPVVVSLGAGWAVSAAVTSLASVSIVGSVGRVVAATVVGVRTIMASLGPVGLAVAGLTFLWMKFHKSAEQPMEIPSLNRAEPGSGGGGIDKLGVGSMTARGLNAFTGFAGLASDPVASRIDRTNRLLERQNELLAAKKSPGAQPTRPDLPI